MKKVTVIILVIVAILITLYFYLKEVYNNLTFNIFFDDLDLSNITSSSFFQGESFARVRLGFVVKYYGFIDFTIYNLVLHAYYNNQLAAKTSNIPANSKPIHLQNNVDNVIYQTFDVYTNGNTLELAYKIKTKQPVAFSYTVSFKLLGFIPIKYNGVYTYKPKTT